MIWVLFTSSSSTVMLSIPTSTHRAEPVYVPCMGSNYICRNIYRVRGDLKTLWHRSISLLFYTILGLSVCWSTVQSSVDESTVANGVIILNALSVICLARPSYQ